MKMKSPFLSVDVVWVKDREDLAPDDASFDHAAGVDPYNADAVVHRIEVIGSGVVVYWVRSPRRPDDNFVEPVLVEALPFLGVLRMGSDENPDIAQLRSPVATDRHYPSFDKIDLCGSNETG